MKLLNVKQFRKLKSNELKNVIGGVNREEYCRTLTTIIDNKDSITDEEIRSFSRALAENC